MLFLSFKSNFKLNTNEEAGQQRQQYVSSCIVAIFRSDTVISNQSPHPRAANSRASPHHLQPQHHSPSILPEPSPGEDIQVWDSPSSARVLAQDMSSGPSPSSSPEIMMDHVLESLDSEPEQDGIFLDFSQRCSGGSTHSRDSSRQSVA